MAKEYRRGAKRGTLVGEILGILELIQNAIDILEETLPQGEKLLVETFMQVAWPLVGGAAFDHDEVGGGGCPPHARVGGCETIGRRAGNSSEVRKFGVIPLRPVCVVVYAKSHIRTQTDLRGLPLNVRDPGHVRAGDNTMVADDADAAVQRGKLPYHPRKFLSRPGTLLL